MENGSEFASLILIIGVIIVLIMLIKSWLERTSFPPLVGYLFLGIILSALDSYGGFLPGEARGILHFMGKVGLVTLLFKVGLESDIKGLAGQLRTAGGAWVGNVVITAAAGFVTCYYLFQLGMVTSLIVGTAFTATSVGISIKVWEEQDALKSPNGSLLVDLAELDDVTAIILMALLFAVIPLLKETQGSVVLTVGSTLGWILLKLALFGGLCYLFSHFLERPLTRFVRRIEHRPDPSLTIAGIGFIIAAMAGILGFSLAIGAFFAGLVFCRDPEVVKLERSFMPVYEFFSPFFFISIGLDFTFDLHGSTVVLAAALLGAALLSKVVANGVPLALIRDKSTALLIGVSMIPRAEIFLVILQKGLRFGSWAVTESIYATMILVSAGTCIIGPIWARLLLAKNPQRPLNNRS